MLRRRSFVQVEKYENGLKIALLSSILEPICTAAGAGNKDDTPLPWIDRGPKKAGRPKPGFLAKTSTRKKSNSAKELF